jgi:hypothetical protein
MIPGVNSREIAVNTLLGFVLIFTFALPFLLALLVIQYVSPIFAAIENYLPWLGRSADAIFYGVLSLSLLIGGRDYFRKQHWRNGFLSIALIAMMLILHVHFQSYFQSEHTFLLVLLILYIPLNAPVSRNEFILAGLLVSAGFAASVGLLGSGALPRFIADFTVLGLFVWGLRRLRNERSSPQPLSPASS